MKKIVFLLPSLRGGGTERVFINIIRNLDQNKFKIHLILLEKTGPYISLLPDNIEVTNLDTIRARKSVSKLIKELNLISPDIVFTSIGQMNILLLSIRLFLKSKPKLVVRESNSPSLRMRKLSIFRKRLKCMFFKFLYYTADGIIAQCHEMKEDMLTTYNFNKPGNIEVIYNPVDIENIRIKSKEVSSLEKNRINLLAVGRLNYQKGFDNLIPAFATIKETVPNAFLTIIGEGEMRSELCQLIQNYNLSNSVDLKGFVSNPYTYYNNCDLYIMSSRWEGFPNSLLEALACKARIVSTNCKTGPKEILDELPDKEIVSVDEIESLAEGILKALKNKHVTTTNYLPEKYYLPNIIKQYENYFLEI